MSDSTASKNTVDPNFARAEMNHKFFLKFLAIGVVCLGLMGWFLYDGLIGYPQRFAPSDAYYGDSSFVDEPASWRETALKNGWDPAIPDTREKIENDIFGQYFFAGLTLLISIPFLAKYLLALGSHIEATPKEIRPSWKAPISVPEITKIDKTRWAEKGIAKLFYGDGKKFVMDDFKFDRQPMSRILFWAESGLADEQIVGGTREPDPDAPAEAEVATQEAEVKETS